MTNGIIDSNQKIVTNGLVLHLDAAQRRSYSGTGTIWTDLSGNGNNGTLTNGPTFNSANGGSIQFDGTNDNVLIPNATSIISTTALTIAMWVKWTTVGTTTSTIQTLFDNNHSANPIKGIVLQDRPDLNKALTFSVNMTNSTQGAMSTSIVGDGNWKYVVGTASNNITKIYVNGVLEGQATEGPIAPIQPNITLGIWQGASFRALNGLIATTSVYNRALSDAEVLQNYNATKARFQVPALLDLYPNAAAAYSLRKLRSGYTGSAIRVRRSSDNTEQDIGFTSTGDLDTTALTTFVGANNGFVTTWYDQSGNNRNATQTTGASQPQIVSGGTIFYRNSKSIIRFNGTSTWFNTTLNNPFSFAGGVSLIHLSYKDATAFKLYETILSAGTTGDALSNVEKTLALGYNNSSLANPIPTISTDIWKPSGIQYNGTVNLNSTHLVGYYISNWSLHRNTGISIIRFNGNDIPTKTYNTTVPQALNTNPIKIGVYDTILATSFFAGEIQEIIAYSSDQSPNRIGIEANINSYYGIYNSNIDSDAQSFITAAAITDSTQQGAVDALVKDLKNYGLWTKMKAIYPFVGGTAAAHKFNLKDPRNVDAAFRLVFSGGMTHNSNGITGNGTDAYFDTIYNVQTQASLNNMSLSAYSRTNLARSLDVFFSTVDGNTNAIYLNPRNVNNEMRAKLNSTTDETLTTSISSSLGLYILNRTSSTQVKIYNNTTTYTYTSNSTATQNSNLYGLRFQTSGYSQRNMCFMHIGDGLTDTEAVNLYTAVQKYQTTLGRQV